MWASDVVWALQNDCVIVCTIPSAVAEPGFTLTDTHTNLHGPTDAHTDRRAQENTRSFSQTAFHFTGFLALMLFSLSLSLSPSLPPSLLLSLLRSLASIVCSKARGRRGDEELLASQNRYHNENSNKRLTLLVCLSILFSFKKQY